MKQGSSSIFRLTCQYVTGLALIIAVTAMHASLPVQSNNAKYVNKAFRDLLSRPATEGELRAFTTQLSNGTPRVRVISAIELLPDHRIQQTRRIYATLLGRQPTAAELKAGAQFLTIGGRVDALEANVIGTNEYYVKKGGGTNAGFISRLYSDAFGGSIRPKEMSGSLNALTQGKSRTTIAREMLNLRNSYVARVNSLFQRYLHRSASQAEVSAFVEIFRGGDREESVIALIMAIDEYYFMGNR